VLGRGKAESLKLHYNYTARL
jgi:hypothetical protein